jgi:hypothetical protein
MSTTPSRQHKTSHFADAAAVDQAMRMALLMIQPSCKDKNVCGAGFLSIIVMKPGLDPRDTPFEEAILLEHAVGDKDEWDADYAAYAKAKARLTWETGLDGSVVQALQPQRLREGDTLLGGAVCLDGIVVGVSGAFPWYDEAFALSIAALIRAQCKARHAAMLQQNKAWASAG